MTQPPPTPTTEPTAAPDPAAAATVTPDPNDAGHRPAPLSWAWVKHTVKRLGPAGPLAVMASVLPPLGGFVLLGFIKQVAPWLKSHEFVGLAIYVGGFIVLAAASLLPTYASSIVGGWTFGVKLGFPAAMLSFCAAGTLAYWINRKAAGTRVVDILKEHPKWDLVCRALIGSGFWRALLIITLVRIPPTSPFAIANFIFGTVRAPFWPYLIGTAIGMAPRTFVVVWAASQLSELNFGEMGGWWATAIGVVLMIGVVAVISAIATRTVRRMTEEEQTMHGEGEGV
ncbi:MAG: TVP38/TMEM64 family protein [Phycisphaerae bacterium]|nr:VTT domain-containing protein [Tepidisphaeraceae bacterium]